VSHTPLSVVPAAHPSRAVLVMSVSPVWLARVPPD
jgi:hypothetical protein